MSDRSIDQICQRTGKEYKQLAIELGLTVPRIDSLDLENKTLVDKARVVLKDHPYTTYRDIGQAIVQVGMDRSIVYDCYTLSEKWVEPQTVFTDHGKVKG